MHTTTDTLSDTQLITTLIHHHTAFTTHKATFLITLGEFTTRNLARTQGSSTTTAWLIRELGASPRTAQEYLHIATKLHRFPLLSENFQHATLSYSKVRLLLRYLTPDNEEELVGLARTLTYPDLEHALHGRKRPGKTTTPTEYLNYRVCPDTGHMTLWARLNPDRATELLAALKIAELASHKTITDSDLTQLTLDELDERLDQAAETPETVPSHRVDQTENEDEPEAADEPGAGAEPQAPPEPTRRRGSRFGPPRHATLLHSLFMMVAMVRSTPRSQVRAPGAEVHLRAGLDGPAHLMGRAGAELRYLHRVLLNAHSQIEVIDERGVQIFCGRSKRTVNAALERMLLAQWEGQCATPGCVHTQFLEFHHILAWAAGGGTDPDNLIPLCSACHALVSAGTLRIEIHPRDPAVLEFFFPDGVVYASHRRGAAGRVAEDQRYVQGELISGDSFDDAALGTA
ncbi:HNH endonuclease [Corynebacterium sp. A21]|uniref:HNH endonuclease n=1 Tax=Corynebacterium sp. A21 TaxID=3457318 RepID=UPI003FD66FF1